VPHAYRGDFQRDRDRIIHSRAFRRLEGKTQVFSANQCDHFRNRLTHTIEVAQVARTAAVTLGLNEEFTEALALAHDLGHPPFGHVGETELNAQMRRFGSSFEHNRHALRIVDLLEERYARFDGLNLTFEVREGIIKHSREITSGDEPDLQEFLPGQKPPIEAQLIDLADEIAYNTADLDDAVSAGLVSPEDIGGQLPTVAEWIDEIDFQFPGASERVRFSEVQRRILNTLTGGLIEGTANAVRESGAEKIGEIRSLADRVGRFTPESKNLASQVRSFLVQRVYSHSRLAAERESAILRMREMFLFLIDHPARLSAGHRAHLETMPVERVVCDYIAGMTDSFLMRTHRELLG
jgi:dGTPase